MGGITNYVATFSPVNGNTISFDSTLSGSNIANVVFANSYVTYNTAEGFRFYSKVTGTTSNTITLQDNFISRIPNVVYGTAVANSTSINTSNITPAWPVAVGNSVTHISDFFSIYDQVSFDGINYKTVVHVDDRQTGNSITINTSFGTAQSGYITLSKNTSSSNIYVSGIATVSYTHLRAHET